MAAYREAADAFPSLTPACPDMFTCVREEMESFVDSCESNHRTFDMDGRRCAQGPVCDGMRSCLNSTGPAMRDCSALPRCYDCVFSGNQVQQGERLRPQLFEYCLGRVCDWLGDGFALGECDPPNVACCHASGDKWDATELVGTATNPEAVRFKHLSTYQLAHAPAFKSMCLNGWGLARLGPAPCAEHAEAHGWSFRLSSTLCDACSSPYIVGNATFPHGLPVFSPFVNMTQDAGAAADPTGAPGAANGTALPSARPPPEPPVGGAASVVCCAAAALAAGTGWRELDERGQRDGLLDKL
eukprot:gene27568-36490_t